MNKNLFKSFALAAVAVIAGACAKESEQLAGPSNVTFEVSTPEIATKAIGDGMTATKLYYQVFDADGNAIEGLGVQNKDLVSGKTTVSFQLIKDQTYNFIFWAQTAEAGYYIIDEAEGLKKITADYATHKGANDENRDAFFAVEKGLKITGPVSKTVKLTRPFAQVNIGTNDELKAGTTTAPAINLTGATSKVVIKGVPTVFAPLATTTETMLTGTTDVTFISAAVPTEKLVVKGVEYNYLAMNYVFAPAEGTVCDITAEFALVGRAPIPLSSPATPIKRNYRTNILGKLLTSSADFNIEVDPGFEGGEEVNLESIKNEASLRALFATGGTAKLAADVDITVLESVSVDEGKEVTLDLNGHKISNSVDLWKDSKPSRNCVISVDGGTLTIKGDGGVAAKANDCYTFDVRKGGKLVIEGGEYAGNVSVIQVQEGLAEVSGGKFSLIQTWSGAGPDGCDYMINMIDSEYTAGNANAVVTGGEFVKFNPADCVAEGAHTSFLAPGYKSTKVGDSYVVTKEDVTVVAEQGDLNDAVKSANKTIYLAAGTYKLPEGSKSIAEGVIIIGNGEGTVLNTKASEEGGDGKYNAQNLNNVTFKNLTINEGNGNYNGIKHSDNLKYENCVIVGQPFSFADHVVYEGCTFNQTSSDAYNIWTYGSKEITFNNCVFNCAGKGVLVYKEGGTDWFKATFNDCKFIASAPVAGKAAIEIDSSLNPYEVYINNCTSEGFDNGSKSGNSLWNNKKGDSTNLKVFVDGVPQTL